MGNGQSIADNDSTPAASDGTDFGTVVAGGVPVTRTFTVRNDGQATLVLGAPEIPTGFTLVDPLAASLDAGASDTFAVRLDATTAGFNQGDIIIATNDGDEDPFNFRIASTVLAPPEIVVVGRGLEIADGDTTPRVQDGTDFGTLLLGDPPPAYTYVVQNTG